VVNAFQSTVVPFPMYEELGTFDFEMLRSGIKYLPGVLTQSLLLGLLRKKNHNGAVSIRKSQLDFLMRLRRTLKELHIIISFHQSMASGRQ
jgi:hypothetical protein